MRLFLGFLLFFLSITTFAQTNDPQNFDSQIQNVIDDSTSNYYYPKLLEKVKNSPAEITVLDSYYLYYGKKYQYVNIKSELKFLPNVTNFQFAVMSNDCEKAAELGKTVIERYPTDVSALAFLAECIEKQKITDCCYYLQRYKNLKNAILSTGDGKSINTAVKVVKMEDASIVLSYFNFNSNQAQENLSEENNRSYSIWEQNDQNIYIEDLWKY